MSATKTMYMHTLDGRAAYYDGHQIVFAGPGRYARKGIRLCVSIADIRREFGNGEAWRERQGFSPTRPEHGYVRVEVPSR